MAKTDSITAEQARAVLAYNAETGKFFRADLQRHTGTINAHGYVVISLLGCHAVKAHRLAWLIHHGEWPASDIDHIDGDRTNNRIANLRLSVGGINAQNQRRPRSDNISGHLGVSWSKAASKWTARIKVGKKYKHLGLFLTAEAAAEAYIQAKREFHAGCTI